jgi:hypothetical protein
MSNVKIAGFAALLTGCLIGGWGLAGVVASGSTDTAAQLYRVTVTKMIKVKDKNGKIHVRVVRSVRIVNRAVLNNITHAETITTPGGTQIITTRTTRVVPVTHIKKQVVTINGKPVTISETVTNMQTQTLAVTQTIAQTVNSTQTIDNTHPVTVTNIQTQTLPPDTVTATETTTVIQTVTATQTTTETTTVVVTTTPPTTTS